MLDVAYHRKKCTVPMMRRAEVAQPEVRLAGQPLQKCAGQSRLADTGLANQQQDPAFALLGLTPAAAQQLKFFLAPDQRGQGDLVLRLKPAFDRALGQHLPSSDMFVKPFESYTAKLAVVEVAAGQPPRARRDNHPARVCQRLQTRREIGGFTADSALLRLARSSQVADDEETGGDD